MPAGLFMPCAYRADGRVRVERVEERVKLRTWQAKDDVYVVGLKPRDHRSTSRHNHRGRAAWCRSKPAH
jgi:hypothetical protein